MKGLQPAPPPPLVPSLSPRWSSAIYEGLVRHRRVRPRPHDLAVRMFMMYLDLDEVVTVFKGRWLWSVERANVASFRRKDYLGGDKQSEGGPLPLKEAVLREVETRLGFRPAGPVRMLTHLRYVGYCFNPVTFYYCFGVDGDRPEAIVAEITNTPWKERHRYVLDGRAGEWGSRVISGEFEKAFHVSPFMPMEQRYRWHFRQPGDRLVVHMENLDASGRIFDATLNLERREIRGASLAGVLLRYPFMTARVVAGIHWHALRLWAKGVPFVSHPKWRHPEQGGRRKNPDT